MRNDYLQESTWCCMFFLN